MFFDDVLVPWERVFLLGDVEMCNAWAGRTNRNAHTGHQVVTKNVVKCEFILGLANLMVQTLGSGQIPQVQQLLAEVIENLEVTKACLRAAEVDAEIDEWGVLCPAYTPAAGRPKAVHRHVPPDGGNPSLVGLQQLDGPALGGGHERPTGSGDKAVPGDRHRHR